MEHPGVTTSTNDIEEDYPDNWSDGSGDFEQECAQDRTQEVPWSAYLMRSIPQHSRTWRADNNVRNRANIAQCDDLPERMKKVFEFLKSLDLDLPTFLYALSGSDPTMRGGEWQTISDERAFLMTHHTLPDILRGLEDHCNRKFGANNPHENPMLSYVLDCTRRTINKDQVALKPVMKLAAADVSGQTLLAINWTQMIEDVQKRAKFWYAVMLDAASTPRQRQDNKLKTAESMVVYQMGSDMFHRSPSHGKPVKLLSLYLRGCGLATKANDTLHHLGIAFSQKWILRSEIQLSEQALAALYNDARQFLWIPNSDNINIGYRVKQQRINNQDHFDSGCLVTIYMLRDAKVVRPSVSDYRRLRIWGHRNPIDWSFLRRLNRDDSKALEPFLIHTILTMLIDSRPFANYKYRCDSLLKPPKALQALEHGRKNRTCQYIMPVQHQEVATYEGNNKIAQWVFGKLAICDDHRDGSKMERQRCFVQNRLITWVGDQLTCARYRGIIEQQAGEFNAYNRCDNLDTISGWFHGTMALATAIHSDFAGTGNDSGLMHTATLTSRRHVHNPKVAGDWFRTADELMIHDGMGSVRALFIQESGQSIDELLLVSPIRLVDLATRIYNKFASSAAIETHQASEELLPEAKRDWKLGKMMLKTRDLVGYALFRKATKTGDVGIMKAFLTQLLFRFVGGGHSNYAVEMAEIIQKLEREYSPEHRNFVLKYCWLINLRGAPDSFMPLDENEEHNIRDAKTIAKTGGVHIPWETMEKMTPAMPVIRGIVDMFETQVNPYRRGKTHSDPEVEQDISKLAEVFLRDRVFEHIPGRKMKDNGEDPKKSIPVDFVKKGADMLRTTDWLEKWAKGRDVDRGTEELWESMSENSEVEDSLDELDEEL